MPAADAIKNCFLFENHFLSGEYLVKAVLQSSKSFESQYVHDVMADDFVQGTIEPVRIGLVRPRVAEIAAAAEQRGVHLLCDQVQVREGDLQIALGLLQSFVKLLT